MRYYFKINMMPFFKYYSFKISEYKNANLKKYTLNYVHIFEKPHSWVVKKMESTWVVNLINVSKLIQVDSIYNLPVSEVLH